MSGYLAGPTALGAAFDRARSWADDLAEDGPDVRVTAHLKTVEEAEELAAEPDDIEEWADVFICLAGAAAQQKWTGDELAAAVNHKIVKNESRTWAQNSDGTWSHVVPVAIEPPAASAYPDGDCIEVVNSCDYIGHADGVHLHVSFTGSCGHGMPKQYPCQSCERGEPDRARPQRKAS